MKAAEECSNPIMQDAPKRMGETSALTAAIKLYIAISIQLEIHLPNYP